MTVSIISVYFAFLGVALAGALVGVCELISRYRDAPLKAVVTLPAGLYLGVNIIASLAALAVIRQARWFIYSDDGTTLLVQSVVAGLAAMAFFRSALFTVRVGSEDVAIGPAGLLQVLLNAADRACDRERAGPRARDIAEIMKAVSFDKAKQALPSLCFGLMQNVSVEEQKAFGIVVKELEAATMDETVKVNNLGLALLNVVGPKVLKEAVSILSQTIHAPPRPIVHSIVTLSLLKTINFAGQGQTLAGSCLFLAGLADDEERRSLLEQRRAEIGLLQVSDDQKTLMLSAYLINVFGEEVVQIALKATQPTAKAPEAANAVAPAVGRDGAEQVG